MAFIHEGKIRDYGRAVADCMAKAGINTSELSYDDVVGINEYKTKREAENAVKEYEDNVISVEAYRAKKAFEKSLKEYEEAKEER